MDAQDAGAVLYRRDADAGRGKVARRGVGHAGDRPDEALARDRRDHGVAHRDHRARGALDDHVLVRHLVEAGARVHADPLARDAGAHERARLVPQKAHDLAHDGGLFGQREAALGGDGALGGLTLRTYGYTMGPSPSSIWHGAPWPPGPPRNGISVDPPRSSVHQNICVGIWWHPPPLCSSVFQYGIHVFHRYARGIGGIRVLCSLPDRIRNFRA